MKYTIYTRDDVSVISQYILADGNKCFRGDVEFRPIQAGILGNKKSKITGPSFEFTDPDHARAFARSIFMAAERLEADIAAHAPVEEAV